MKRKSLLIFAFAACMALVANLGDVAASRSGRIPLSIASRYGPAAHPAWISARAALNSKGELDFQALPRDLARSIQRQIESGDYEKQGCIQTLEVQIDPLPGPVKAKGTLEDLAKNSIDILYGTVTDIDSGFGSHGTPALLLEVEVAERIKHSAEIADSAYLYLEYPVANFEAGGYRFCKKDRRWPEPPGIGDRVMIFPYSPPVDEAGQVIAPSPDGFEVIGERKGAGALLMPQALRDLPDFTGVKQLDTVRERMAEHIQRITRSRNSGS